MTAPRMTDARLDRIREMVAEGVLDDHVGTLAELLEELRLTRADAQRYRSRCPVTAEDVEAAGVTAEHAGRWLAAQKCAEGFESLWASWVEDWTSESFEAGDIADMCHEYHEDWGGPMSMLLLDEMAAMAGEPSP